MKTVVILAGRFQPFHTGHYRSYKHLLKEFPNADVYIATSNKTDSVKSPFNFMEKKMVMTKMFKIPSNRIIQVKNPYNPQEILSKYPEDETVYIAALGGKDSKRLGGKYFQPYKSATELQPYTLAGYVYTLPSRPNEMSGTLVRQWLSVPDEIEAENGFIRVYDKFNKEIYTLLRSKLVNINEMAKSDLDDVERFADTKLAPHDFEFGKQLNHFFARLNDPRNGKQITKPEMIGFFKRLIKNRKWFDAFTERYLEFVITDKRTNINMPFIKIANKLIAKTIMRKPSFKSPDPIMYIENIELPVDVGDTVLMGRFKNKKVKVKHIGKDKHGMPTINGKKATTFRMSSEPISENENELASLEKERNRLFNMALKTFPNSPKQLKIRKQLDSVISKIKKLKENRIESSTESVLLEGGSYGHMAHPFDIDMDLTFGDLKDIVNKALDGELELAREKTDGQALAISWKNGRLIAARNKGNLANAGANAMTEDELISKFAGRGELSNAFAFAIRDLRKALGALPENAKQRIFKEGRVFMNCEIIYPESVNVIPYGQSLIVFHGTMEYDDSGNAISENPQSGILLASMIADINANVQDRFSIQGPPIQSLPKNKELKDKKPFYLNQIKKLQNEYGLNDDSGISEYHQAWWSEWIDDNSPGELSDDEKDGLIKRWAFMNKDFRIRNISDPITRTWADKIDKTDFKSITKQNIMKFERIFLGVGADVLSFMTSVLTVNPESVKKQMVRSLKSTIKDIQKSGNPSSIKKLEIELKRLQDLGGFSKIVPSEGIVFVYKGNTYKLTGAFAPLNQILGIFKYSR